MQKFCISVDWLQTFNHAAPLEKEIYQDGHYTFQVHREDYSTQLFTDVFTVRHGNLVVATILQHPRSTAINARATMVKLSNRVLYSQKYIEYLYAINRAMNIEYKGITRLDLCYDCNALHDGRDVGRFIRQYHTNETPSHPARSTANETHKLTHPFSLPQSTFLSENLRKGALPPTAIIKRLNYWKLKTSLGYVKCGKRTALKASRRTKKYRL